jgi:hypothetical protein
MKIILFAVIAFSFTNIFSQVKNFNDLKFTEKSFKEKTAPGKIYSLKKDLSGKLSRLNQKSHPDWR